jgi:hypothetical protein
MKIGFQILAIGCFLLVLSFIASVFIMSLFNRRPDTYPFTSHPEDYNYLLPLKIELYYNKTKYVDTFNAKLIWHFHNNVTMTEIENETYINCAEFPRIDDVLFFNGIEEESYIRLHTNQIFLLNINGTYYMVKTFQLSDTWGGYCYCSPAFHWIKLDLCTREYWNGY